MNHVIDVPSQFSIFSYRLILPLADTVIAVRLRIASLNGIHGGSCLHTHCYQRTSYQ